MQTRIKDELRQTQGRQRTGCTQPGSTAEAYSGRLILRGLVRELIREQAQKTAIVRGGLAQRAGGAQGERAAGHQAAAQRRSWGHQRRARLLQQLAGRPAQRPCGAPAHGGRRHGSAERTAERGSDAANKTAARGSGGGRGGGGCAGRQRATLQQHCVLERSTPQP